MPCSMHWEHPLFCFSGSHGKGTFVHAQAAWASVQQACRSLWHKETKWTGICQTAVPWFGNVKQYPLPFESYKVVEEEVRKMLDLLVIEPSTPFFESPVVLVKKNGSTWFCIDFWELKKVTEFDVEPIPDVGLFTSLQGNRYFTKVDLIKEYWQLKMDPDDKEKTAFRTPVDCISLWECHSAWVQLLCPLQGWCRNCN